jgi:enamine deaminase RidA (YjgF/YER057c/UK114 family)
MSHDQKLRELGLSLPPAPAPVATYIPAVRAGDLLFLSGVLPFKGRQLAFQGKVGRDLSVEQGYESATLAVLNALALIQQECGTLDQVKKIVRVVGHVASAEGFVQQPAVVNGASDLLVKIFGDAGRHARLAVGAAELPLNAPVELEIIIQLQS